MRSLIEQEIAMISGGHSSFNIQKFEDTIYIIAFDPGAVLEFNNFTFIKVGGCYFNNILVTPDDSYSGYRVTTLHDSVTHRTFELKPA